MGRLVGFVLGAAALACVSAPAGAAVISLNFEGVNATYTNRP